MCNTFAVYFQIFATFGYKKVKNSEKINAILFPDSIHLPRETMYRAREVDTENNF